MDSIEKAYLKKLKLAELYGVSVTSIVWAGKNKFIVCKDGKDIWTEA